MTCGEATCACAGEGLSGAPAGRPGGRTGPLRNGNPRGNPNLAPRCGAKARSGNPCRAPAMANGRCRMHGGNCTGPRTPEGKARMIAAHTTHGNATAAKRATQRYVRALAARARLLGALLRLRAYLPAEMAARLTPVPGELKALPHPSQVAVLKSADRMPCTVRDGVSGMGRAAAGGRKAGAAGRAPRVRDLERQAALAEAAGQAPWRQAIAFARAAKRAARAEKRVRRAGTAGGTTQIARSDVMQREAERLVRAAAPSPMSRRDPTSPAGQTRCGQRTTCSNDVHSPPTREPAAGHLARWGTCPGGETEGVARAAPSPGHRRDATPGSGSQDRK